MFASLHCGEAQAPQLFHKCVPTPTWRARPVFRTLERLRKRRNVEKDQVPVDWGQWVRWLHSGRAGKEKLGSRQSCFYWPQRKGSVCAITHRKRLENKRLGFLFPVQQSGRIGNGVRVSAPSPPHTRTGARTCVFWLAAPSAAFVIETIMDPFGWGSRGRPISNCKEIRNHRPVYSVPFSPYFLNLFLL